MLQRAIYRIYDSYFQVAKLLQNLANKPTYSKEKFMMSLNPFVEQNKARINRFLIELGEVGDFHEALEVWQSSCGSWNTCWSMVLTGVYQMEQYVALSKKEIQLNITLNEMYNTHSLLAQHLDVLVRFEFTDVMHIDVVH